MKFKFLLLLTLINDNLTNFYYKTFMLNPNENNKEGIHKNNAKLK